MNKNILKVTTILCSLSFPLITLADDSAKANAKAYVENNDVDTTTSGNTTTTTITTRRNSEGYTVKKGKSGGDEQVVINNNENKSSTKIVKTGADTYEVSRTVDGTTTTNDYDASKDGDTTTIVNTANNNTVKRTGSKKDRDSTTTVTKTTGKTYTTDSGKTFTTDGGKVTRNITESGDDTISYDTELEKGRHISGSQTITRSEKETKAKAKVGGYLDRNK